MGHYNIDSVAFSHIFIVHVNCQSIFKFKTARLRKQKYLSSVTRKYIYGCMFCSDRGPVRLHPARGHLQVPHLLLGVPAQAARGRRQEAGPDTPQAGHRAAARRGQRSDQTLDISRYLYTLDIYTY